MTAVLASLKNRLRQVLKKIFPVRILVVFYKHVWKGFCIYKQFRKEYGDDVKFVSCTPLGTGDYYIHGQFFDAWCKKNNVTNYVTIVGGNAEKNVLGLFPYINKKYVKLGWDSGYPLLAHLLVFLGVDKPDVEIFHHIAKFGTAGYTENLWMTWFLMGYKDLSQTDFYKYYGYELPNNVEKVQPHFTDSEERIDHIFEANNLIPGKTVLIAPYSTGLGSLVQGFWDTIVKELNYRGFTVCTNCFGDEQPLEGTVPLALPYKDSVPFLNKAGYFMGIRCGICDIISSSTCKKFIIHTYYAQHWPNGNSIPYTGLNNMGLCMDAIEYELAPGNVNMYEIQNQILIKMGLRPKQQKKAKTIRIKFVDVPPDFDPERHWITRTLRKRYNVVFSDTPEFLFYSVFGIEFDQYQNCVKIFFTGEDTIPNFNECDYAMCHDHITFGDRYIRADIGERYGKPIGALMPDWIKTGIDSDLWINSSVIDIRRGIQDRSIVSKELLDRKFCNFVYSNDVFGEGAVLRKQFCLELMKYRHVDCPGRILTNMKDGIPLRWGIKDGRDSIAENWAVSKLEFIKNYKFTIAFENLSVPGHTTEKLIHPLYAYSVPIYWGNPEVVKDFNPKAFINCNDYGNDFRRIIKRIIELDNDDEQYLEMLRQPPMQPDFDFDQDKKAEEFLYHIIQKGNKPYTKCSLAFSAANISRNSYRELLPLRQELERIHNSDSWKAMSVLWRFSNTPVGQVFKSIFHSMMRFYRRMKSH